MKSYTKILINTIKSRVIIHRKNTRILRKKNVENHKGKLKYLYKLLIADFQA